MFANFLILFAISICLERIFRYFLFDLLCFPFNGVYVYFLNKNDYTKQAYASMIGSLLAFIVFTYLFLGIGASYVAWAALKSADSEFLKFSALAFSLGIPFSLRRKSFEIVQQDPSFIKLPSIRASRWVPFSVFITSVLFVVFPELMTYWSWMPFVD